MKHYSLYVRYYKNSIYWYIAFTQSIGAEGKISMYEGRLEHEQRFQMDTSINRVIYQKSGSWTYYFAKQTKSHLDKASWSKIYTLCRCYFFAIDMDRTFSQVLQMEQSRWVHLYNSLIRGRKWNNWTHQFVSIAA